MHQAPTNFGLKLSRWTLGAIKDACSWLEGYTLSGIWHILKWMGIHYKRGQEHLHSPDLDYVAKRDRIRECLERAREKPGEVVLMYLDEFTFTRWPSLAQAYHPKGRAQPRAEMWPGFNTRGRVVAAMDAVSGKVVYMQRTRIPVKVLVEFMTRVREAYPGARELYVVQDNWWNVHFHPLQVARAEALAITLLPLPTYSPWLNPIEKLGRMLRQQVTHMHPDGHDWPHLKERVCSFFDQFSQGSKPLLKYVALLPT